MANAEISGVVLCRSNHKCYWINRGHSRILIQEVRNTNGLGLFVGNDGNCKGFRY